MPGTRRIRRALGCIAATLALAALLAPVASAAPTWLGARALGLPQTIPAFNGVAMNRNGDLIATWVDGSFNVNAVARQAGGAFGTPVPLSNTGGVSQSSVALSDVGDGWAAWCVGSSLHIAVRAAGRLFTRDGTTGTDTALPCSGDGGPPAVVTGPGRTALFAWLDFNGTCDVVRTLQLTIQGSSHTPPGVPGTRSDCAGGGSATVPRVAENAQGAAAVVFEQGGNVRLTTRSGLTTAFVPSIADIVSGGGAADPSVAVSPTGKVAAVWRAAAVEAITGNAGDNTTFATPGQPVSSPAGTIGPPDVAFDTAGTAIVGWVDNNPSLRAWTATKPASSPAFGLPVQVPGGGGASPVANSLDLATDGRGGAVLLFTRGAQAFASARPPSGAFGTAVPVSAASEQASQLHLGLDGGGDGVAALSAKSGTQYSFKVAPFDAAPPALRGLTVSSGQAGQALNFSVAPFDVWSAGSQIATNWAFGDGGSAGGTTVTHAYGAAGTFGLNVTATDAVGNASSAGAAIGISPAPVPDSDGDGFRDDQDCQPNNPKVFPGAKEIPENGKDENCDKVDGKLPRIDPPAVFWAFDLAKTHFKVTRIRFDDIPNGVKAFARCSGKGCPFKQTKSVKSRKHKLNLLPKLRGKVNFKPGQTLEVRATRKGFMGRVIRVKLKKGKIPKATRLCLKPGTKRPRSCR
jgi:hypothetical protein